MILTGSITTAAFITVRSLWYTFTLRSLFVLQDAKGLSRKTQQLHLILDMYVVLMWEVYIPHHFGYIGYNIYQGAYKSLLVLASAMSTLAMCSFSRHPAASTYDGSQEKIWHWLFIAFPCSVLAYIGWANDDAATISNALFLLECLAIIPQIQVHRQFPSDENFTGAFLIFMRGISAFLGAIQFIIIRLTQIVMDGMWGKILILTMSAVICLFSAIWPVPNSTESFCAKLCKYIREALSWQLALVIAFPFALALRMRADISQFETILVGLTFTGFFLMLVFLTIDHIIFSGSICLVPYFGCEAPPDPAAQRQQQQQQQAMLTRAEQMVQPLLVDQQIAVPETTNNARTPEDEEQAWIQVASSQEDDQTNSPTTTSTTIDDSAAATEDTQATENSEAPTQGSGGQASEE
eukprot:CAMPEP_0119556538 /NCGR_PEP_ID=MMETSP1352-20130426/8449_1 /TAXON_ID=265584 /ORGANISM="Stauroneis constricta, Strain CCMP1120" /LENGTH=407 /DNA_ID=CAMNT_0007603507 /DNA_START=29 /DNA_END=1252 /DNA_ORIENTATION=+